MADLYDLMKKSQLQDECRKRGLSYSKRTNDVLRNALRAHDALNNANGNNANGNNANGNNTNNNGANNNGANNSAANRGGGAPGTIVVNGAVRCYIIS